MPVPLAAVFQPLNTAPVLARVPWLARVVILAVPFAVVVTGDEAPVPPFASKVIVEFHCA